MAIEALRMPEQGADAGLFNLPAAFDTKVHAAQWVDEKNVDSMKQRQPLPQVGATADGWEVWKPEGNKGQPAKVHAGGNKIFVLMCRPRAIQDQVNALFGNVSKRLINREVKGETVGGFAPQDPGILTEERLRANGQGSLGTEESLMPMNAVGSSPSAAVET